MREVKQMHVEEKDERRERRQAGDQWMYKLREIDEYLHSMVKIEKEERRTGEER